MKVTANNFSHEFNFFSQNEIFFDRKQSYSPDYAVTDVYGAFWSFLFADVPAGGLSLIQGEIVVPISGRVGMLIPPDTVVHWHVGCSELHWFAYSNNNPYPSDFPREITIYPLAEIPPTISPNWISELIQQSTQAITTVRGQSYNPYAKKLKALLDNEFKLNKSLQEYATQLGLSKEWLIKYFKKSYALTPIDYRNKKRMMEALFRLHVEKEKIIDLSQNVGFNDLKHFNQLFKRAISLPPSKFIAKDISR